MPMVSTKNIWGSDVQQWAARHGISAHAIQELEGIFGLHGGHELPHNVAGRSEAAVQVAVRLEAAQLGVRLFRNNVGALIDSRGVPVRYGLANDSKQVNAVVKSSDLIGWRRVTVEQHHVGQHIAQFVSRECKAPGWKYTGTARERAQLKWLELVAAGGGDAAFCTGLGTFERA